MIAALTVFFAAVGGFDPVDLSAHLNANPLSDADMDTGGVDIPGQESIWIEGEAAGARSEGLGDDPAARASGGLMLGGGFGNTPGDYGEWYFNLPFDCKIGILYLRTTRAGENAFTSLTCTVNGEERGEVLIPVNQGWGDSDEDFRVGLCSVQIGRLHMGRQVLRLTAGDTFEPIAIDGFWVTNDRLDIVNRVGEDGFMRPTASPYLLLYPFGTQVVDHVPFNLVDPADNAGNAIVVLKKGESITIDAAGGTLHLLGAGVRGPVTIGCASGSAVLGSLYTRDPEGAALAAGRYRVLYRSALERAGGDGAAWTLTAEDGDAILLAATLETASETGPKP